MSTKLAQFSFYFLFVVCFYHIFYFFFAYLPQKYVLMDWKAARKVRCTITKLKKTVEGVVSSNNNNNKR